MWTYQEWAGTREAIEMTIRAEITSRLRFSKLPGNQKPTFKKLQKCWNYWVKRQHLLNPKGESKFTKISGNGTWKMSLSQKNTNRVKKVWRILIYTSDTTQVWVGSPEIRNKRKTFKSSARNRFRRRDVTNSSVSVGAVAEKADQETLKFTARETRLSPHRHKSPRFLPRDK